MLSTLAIIAAVFLIVFFGGLYSFCYIDYKRDQRKMKLEAKVLAMIPANTLVHQPNAHSDIEHLVVQYKKDGTAVYEPRNWLMAQDAA